MLKQQWHLKRSQSTQCQGEVVGKDGTLAVFQQDKTDSVQCLYNAAKIQTAVSLYIDSYIKVKLQFFKQLNKGKTKK